MDNTCKQCKHYTDESHTTTGIGIAYCGHKESKHYGLQDDSIQTVVYENGKCRYFESGEYEQMSLF